MSEHEKGGRLLFAFCMSVLAATASGQSEGEFKEQEKVYANGVAEIVAAARKAARAPTSGFSDASAKRALDRSLHSLEQIQDACAGRGRSGKEKAYVQSVVLRIAALKCLSSAVANKLPTLCQRAGAADKKTDQAFTGLAGRRDKAIAKGKDALRARGQENPTDELVVEINDQLHEARLALYRVADELATISYETGPGYSVFPAHDDLIASLRRVKVGNEKELKAIVVALVQAGDEVAAAARSHYDRAHDGYVDDSKEFERVLDRVNSSFIPDWSKSKYAGYLDNDRIRGERVLVGKHWRILVRPARRSAKMVEEWLIWYANRTGEQAFERMYGAGTYAPASNGVTPKGYQIHHIRPLYIGVENGADNSKGNLELLSESEHQRAHSDSGKAAMQWGPPSLYLNRNMVDVSK